MDKFRFEFTQKENANDASDVYVRWYLFTSDHAGYNRKIACHAIFRLDANSKIVEHWDVCQPVPKLSEFKHNNGMC